MGVVIPQVVSEDRASGAQVIDGGLRFDSGKSHYLSRTPSSAGNRRTWTWSGWFKRSKTNNNSRILCAQIDGSNRVEFMMSTDSTDQIRFELVGANGADVYTNALLRDFSSWYHVVLVVDTTQSISSDRIAIYINGIRATFSSATYPGLNAEFAINAVCSHAIGKSIGFDRHFDGYHNSVYFIDGQQLDASYFGYTDPLTNTWRPKKFSAFNNPNNGTTWSNFVSPSSAYPGYPLSNGFDSSDTTEWLGDTNGQTITLTRNISYSSNVQIKVGGQGATVSVNGGAGITVSANTWTTLVTGSGTLSTLSWTPLNNQLPSLFGIKIDGYILIDGAADNSFHLPFDGSAPIGQDQSGRGNNWTAVNFGGSNTIEKATGALPILNTDGGGKVARVGVRTDANASSLVLALPLVGIKSDFSNAVNSGTSNKAVTVVGGASASNAQSVFYGGSYLFDGTNGRLDIPNTDFNFGTGDYTCESWVYLTATGDEYVCNMQTNNSGSPAPHWGINFYSTNLIRVGRTGDSNGDAVHMITYTFTTNRWYHIAVSRQSGTSRVFLDGVKIDEVSDTRTIVPVGDLKIGSYYQNGPYLNGYIQDLRIYKGAAKYTSNFIPASTDPDIVPDSPSGVSYSSNVALVPSTDGAITVTDPGNSYLSVASSNDFNFGTGDFTIEGFFYIDSSGSNNSIFDLRNSGSTSQYLLRMTSSTAYDFRYSGSSLGTFTAADKVWNHIAISRASGTTRIFVNGVQTNSFADTNNASATGPLLISTFQDTTGSSSSFGFNGFVSNLHIVKGTALYTSNFTPPSAPISSVANTKLLCCKSNSSAKVYDIAPTSNYVKDFSNNATGYTVTGYTVDKVFDTDTSNFTIVTTSAPFTFTPLTPISYSSSIVVKVNTGSGSPMAFNLNGAGYGSYNLYNGDQEVTVVSGSGTLTSLAIAVNAGGGANFYYIKVDGNILYDTISVLGNAAASNFNPFTANINTQRGKQSGYCTWNPLNKSSQVTISNGNLNYSASGSNTNNGVLGTIAVSSGKWYWEYTCTSSTSGTNFAYLGIAGVSALPSTLYGFNSTNYIYQATDGNKKNNDVSTAYGASWTTGDIIGVAFDADAGTLTFYKNNISQGVAFSSIPSNSYTPSVSSYASGTVSGLANFGQKPFKFPPPAGFQPLTLANTPRPTLVRPDQYVGVTTYTGNGGTQSLNTGFKPDFVWIKCRDASVYHALFDSVRGVNKRLGSNETSAEQDQSPSGLSQFLSNGFTVVDGATGGNGINGSPGGLYAGANARYVAWAWKAGGNSNTFNINDVGYATASAAGLTAGTITPTGASVNTKSGFSIIGYTGTGATGGTVAHGLGKSPSFIIAKSRSTRDWIVYHKDLTKDKYLNLNATTGESSTTSVWGSNEPTSSVFGVYAWSTAQNNANGENIIAYCWAEIPGFSKFGSYTGNGSTNFVNVGFRPRWIMIKRAVTNSSPDQTNDYSSWTIYDTERNKYNGQTANHLYANKSINEGYRGNASSTSDLGDITINALSNGFYLSGAGTEINANTATYIYACWAETPTFNLYGAQANAR